MLVYDKKGDKTIETLSRHFELVLAHLNLHSQRIEKLKEQVSQWQAALAKISSDGFQMSITEHMPTEFENLVEKMKELTSKPVGGMEPGVAHRLDRLEKQVDEIKKQLSELKLTQTFSSTPEVAPKLRAQTPPNSLETDEIPSIIEHEEQKDPTIQVTSTPLVKITPLDRRAQPSNLQASYEQDIDGIDQVQNKDITMPDSGIYTSFSD